MKKLLGFIITAIFLFPLAVSSQKGARLTEEQRKDPALQLQKFSQFYRYLNTSYIDTVNTSKVIEDAIKDILSELDPHSSYYSPEEMVEVSETFDGKFSGIGVQINILNDTLRVAGVITGGPSEKVGVLPNDRIISVNGESIVGLKQTEAVKKLRGPKGSEANITVIRAGSPAPLQFRIIRDDISLNTVDASYMPEPGIGYIRVNRFANNTMTEFKEAFDKFDAPEAVILDLRGNGGGLLGQSIEMANFFLPKGSMIVYTEGRAYPSEAYRARREGTYLKGKVVVLIDEFSASASEIVSGALQDWDRAVIVGRRSFGKGLVQRQYPLIDGSAVNITISKYLTPAGRAIQRPYEQGKGTDYYERFAERLGKSYTDSLNTADSLRFTTLRLGKYVYEGAGIYPDYYVPVDTSGYTDYLGSIIRNGVLHEYVNTYIDKHRNELLQQYTDVYEFRDSFTVTGAMFRDLQDLGVKRDIPVNEEQFAESRSLIDKRIKSLLAQNLWGDTAAYIIANDKDPVLDKALDIIRNWNTAAKNIATSEI